MSLHFRGKDIVQDNIKCFAQVQDSRHCVVWLRTEKLLSPVLLLVVSSTHTKRKKKCLEILALIQTQQQPSQTKQFCAFPN